MGAILSLAGLGVLAAFALWRVAIMRTGPEGYTLLNTFFELETAKEARGVLEGVGIKVILEDVRSRLLPLPSAMPWGSVNLFVPTQDAEQAADTLAEVVKGRHQGPPS